MPYSITFVFDEKKATQAACHILSLNEGRMNYMKLIKLLYLSDREFISEWSNSITTDSYVSMDNGPVTSHIYDLIKNARGDSGTYWASFIRTEDYDAVLKKTPETYSELSPMEMEVMESVSAKFADMSEWDVVSYCHENLGEWQNPSGSAIPITIEDIIHAAKEGEDVEDSIEEMTIAADVQKSNFMFERALKLSTTCSTRLQA